MDRRSNLSPARRARRSRPPQPEPEVSRRAPWLLGLILVLGLGGTIPAAADEGWSIDAFDVVISIHADASMTVRESLQVDFGSQQHHGIFRDIPVVYDWDQHHQRVYDLNVQSVTDSSGRPWSYTTSDNGADREIKIGDPNQTISGPQSYVITYTVNGALNGFADHDELYWNVTGQQWGVPIKAATATVAIPGAEPLWTACFQGETGSREACQESSGAEQARFTSTRVLDPGQQLTVVVAMKKGLVGPIAPILRAKPRTFIEFFALEPGPIGVALAILILGLFWLGRMVWRRGRDMEYATAYYSTRDPTERIRPLFRPEAVVPEYGPPDNLRPAQLGLILDESADTKDVTATIIDLAVRGYLVIKDVKNGRHEWELVQVKDSAAGLLPYEATIFNGLFDGKEKQTRLSAIKGKFRFTLGQAEKMLYEDSVRLRWFSANPQSTRINWVMLGVLAVLVGFGVAWALGALAGWGLVGVAIILLGGSMIATNSWMPRRTALGTDLFKKTLGFRVYMNTAEKDRQAFAEKAEIFTQYLPYAIVFGCVHRWAKAFEGIDTSAAVSSWYQGPGPFLPVAFASGLEGFSNTLSTTIAETPGGSGGSGGGGGGFSGGGGGGGGGGAW